MRDEPLIFAGCSAKRTKAEPAMFKIKPSAQQLQSTEKKGYLLINELWKKGTYSVHDMHVVNIDAKSHSAKTPEKCLQEAERKNKKMHQETCLQKRQHFPPFVNSVDGLMGVEVAANLKNISRRLTTKWRQPYSRTCGYVKSRIVITLVRATHRCIQEYRVPEHKISVQRMQ